MKSELEKYGIQMPAFSKIGGILANELSVDEAACERGSGVVGRGQDLTAADYLLHTCFDHEMHVIHSTFYTVSNGVWSCSSLVKKATYNKNLKL